MTCISTKRFGMNSTTFKSTMRLPNTILPVFVLIFVLAGCSEKPAAIHDLSGKDYTLLNQDSSIVHFPGDYRGKTVVIGFIYTHCPDICPMTTHNIQLVKNELDTQGAADVTYIDISFDPTRDTPSVLKRYADLFGITTDNFTLLTGSTAEIRSLLKDVDMYAIPEDTTVTGNDTAYYFIHTDRISIMDPEGKIRYEIKGSTAKKEDLINDITSIRN